MSITISGSSGIVGANGSASAPALTGGDFDSGIFFPNPNTVAFSAGGTEVFRANANGIFATANVNVTNLNATNLTATNVIPTSSYLRNRIINGDMRINQRGYTSAAPLTTNAGFAVDRFQIGSATTGGFSAYQSSTAPTGFTNSLLFTKTTGASAAASDGNYIVQQIEGNNIYDLAWGTANAKTITISFWVYAGATGTFSGSLRNSTATYYSYPFTYTISAANTWTQISVTIAGPTVGTWATDNTAGLVLFFDLGSGSTLKGTAGAWVAGNYVGVTGATTYPTSTTGGTFYVTGVQFEVGSVATPFERQIYGNQLAQCQRYYQRIGDSTVVLFSGNTSAGSDFYQSYTLQTEMRTTANATRVGTWTLGNATTQPTFVATSKMFRVNSQITATGQGYVQAGTGIYVSFDAEL